MVLFVKTLYGCRFNLPDWLQVANEKAILVFEIKEEYFAASMHSAYP